MVSVLGLITDLITISQGGIPIDQIARTIASVVRSRRKGKTRAQMKKKEMRKRRRFVDTVVMEHERRVQKQNLENRINETKDRLDKIRKDQEEKSLARAAKLGTSRPRNSRYGNQESDYDDENEDQKDQEHLNKVQQIIADRQNNPNQNWSNKINNGRGDGSARGA